jgi:DNA primase
MAKIPEETLQQVLASTDIVDLIGRSVKLRRAGTNWVGLCPFHNEKSPSFNVRPSTNSYHCFGCGAGGNAFRFVMEHDGLTFMEAVKRLAEAAGIRIQEEVWDANAEKEAKIRSLMIRAHQDLAAWYHQLLMKSPVAEEARAYLKGRGITSAVAKNWMIGYAPPDAVSLRRWADSHRYDQEFLLETGILKYSEDRGIIYPGFSHRLMFPIRNDNGEVIAFSGRALSKTAKAKYLNSPETPIFNKSKVLFGFDKSKRPISKAGQAIVCEGQIDTIMIFEAGFQNVVAGQGTAFTEFHAKALKRVADEIVLCYDSDNAGFKAAEKAFQILAPSGLIVKVAELPTGEDPDSLLRKEGVDGFTKLLSKAEDFIQYQLFTIGKRRDLSGMKEKIKFAQEMADNVWRFNEPVARQVTIIRVANTLGIPEETMKQLVSEAQKRAATKPDKVKSGDTPSGQQLLASQDRNALLLCQLALADAQVLDWLRQQPHDDILRDLPGTELLGLVWRGNFDPLDPVGVNVFLTGLDHEEESALTQILHQSTSLGGVEAAQHAMSALEIARLQMQKQRLQTQLKHPSLDAEDAAEIQREIMALHRELQEAQKRILKPQ